MVLGLIGIAAGAIAIPLSATSTSTSVIGIAQGTNAQGKSDGGGQPSEKDKQDPRLAKFTVRTECDDPSTGCDEAQIVLRNGKLYVDHRDPARRKYRDGHAFSGFYLEYPWEAKPLGLVSTIKPDPPELNWIFINRNTLELNYGPKSASLPHIPGPWDWTSDQVAITFNGAEPFVALEETPGNWILCCDLQQDLLASAGAGNRRVIEISLNRKLLPPPPPEA